MTDVSLPASDRRTALAPDLRTMPDRAARAWAERMAVRPRPGSEYAVDSHSGATYLVDPVAGTCSCPDHRIRGETCKHLRRVAIEITTGRVPPPGERAATCVACEADSFVPEDADVPLCRPCRVEPGDVVLDGETGDRLVVRALLAADADEVPVRDGDTTVADYPTNGGYPDDDPVVEAVYLGSLDRESPRVYRFPLSRLDRTDAAILA